MKFKLLEGDIQAIKKVLLDYVNSEKESWGHWWGDLEDYEDETILTLTTGNRWTVNVKEETLEYKGSRIGFHEATPFRSQKIFISADEAREVLTIIITSKNESGELVSKEHIFKLINMETTNPQLKWCEFVIPLAEQKGKAVVYHYVHGYRIPLRVIDYQNVYRY